MPPRRREFGSTWWGEQWIGALEALGSTWTNRLPRGRTYARRGAVTTLVVSAGGVNARVHGSRPRPYRVALRLPALDNAQWENVVAELVAEARFCAQLLAGEMPRDVDAAFRAAGVTLFPRRASELDLSRLGEPVQARRLGQPTRHRPGNGRRCGCHHAGRFGGAAFVRQWAARCRRGSAGGPRSRTPRPRTARPARDRGEAAARTEGTRTAEGARRAAIGLIELQGRTRGARYRLR